jgi:hypothetical protein
MYDFRGCALGDAVGSDRWAPVRRGARATMIHERMTLIGLVEKQVDGEPVREMLACAAERIMEQEVEARAGAAKGARSSVQEGRRNAYLR